MIDFVFVQNHRVIQFIRWFFALWEEVLGVFLSRKGVLSFLQSFAKAGLAFKLVTIALFVFGNATERCFEVCLFQKKCFNIVLNIVNCIK